MNFFYFDEKIKKYEKELDFSPVISYLEEIFNQKPSEDILVTLIGSSWYYLVEGDVNQSPQNYDWKYFLDKWKQYIDIGIAKFNNSEKFCYIAGYTLSLHGIYISPEYEKKGKQLMCRCAEIATTPQIVELSQTFIAKSCKYRKLDKQSIMAMFPSESLPDKYFKEIILR